ncbi:hypothetical protein GCM10011412_01000 [Maribacter cobaltidurans]|nr:hypothetical protein GCM10011412_01000 [Maribacter cobaltidurans]
MYENQNMEPKADIENGGKVFSSPNSAILYFGLGYQDTLGTEYYRDQDYRLYFE